MVTKHAFELEAEVRNVQGKGASRRLRRENKLPAVIYGGGKTGQPLTLEHNKVLRALENEAFYSHILTLKIGGESEKVILKDMQRHAFKPRILHMDFQRVRADEKLQMNIPLHFTGEDKAPGVKAGGLISHLVSDVEVSCFPDNLPESLTIDLATLELNQILHLSDIQLPKGVELVELTHGHDTPIVSIHIPRVEEEPLEVEAPPAEVPAIAQKSGDEGTKED